MVLLGRKVLIMASFLFFADLTEQAWFLGSAVVIVALIAEEADNLATGRWKGMRTGEAFRIAHRERIRFVDHGGSLPYDTTKQELVRREFVARQLGHDPSDPAAGST